MDTPLSLGAKLSLGATFLFGLLYLGIGMAWVFAPAGAAAFLEASLLEGTGLATQLADSAAFFLCSGAFMLYGVLKRRAGFLMAGAILIGLVAPMRLIAWQFHGAPLTLQPIIIEVLTFLAVAGAAATVRGRQS